MLPPQNAKIYSRKRRHQLQDSQCQSSSCFSESSQQTGNVVEFVKGELERRRRFTDVDGDVVALEQRVGFEAELAQPELLQVVLKVAAEALGNRLKSSGFNNGTLSVTFIVSFWALKRTIKSIKS